MLQRASVNDGFKLIINHHHHHHHHHHQLIIIINVGQINNNHRHLDANGKRVVLSDADERRAVRDDGPRSLLNRGDWGGRLLGVLAVEDLAMRVICKMRARVCWIHLSAEAWVAGMSAETSRQHHAE